jgi:protein-L-isoaspartate O-methyltransferase
VPAILPPWTDSDPDLHARLTGAIDPDRKVLEALERIVPLSGKRIADVGTGIGHYPMLLARRTGRTYGIETDPDLLAEARRRAPAEYQDRGGHADRPAAARRRRRHRAHCRHRPE